MSDTIVVSELSKWFGLKVAVSEVTIGFRPGVTGLLGPNGAGKTTLYACDRWPPNPFPGQGLRPGHRPTEEPVRLPKNLFGARKTRRCTSG